MSSPEENKRLIRRLFEVGYNQNDRGVRDEIYADNVKIRTPGRDEPYDKTALEIGNHSWFTAFPDVQSVVREQIAEGDIVVTVYNDVGTHLGVYGDPSAKHRMFVGAPPTGRRFDYPCVNIDRIENGRIVESWSLMDRLIQLQQLGYVEGEDQ